MVPGPLFWHVLFDDTIMGIHGGSELLKFNSNAVKFHGNPDLDKLAVAVDGMVMLHKCINSDKSVARETYNDHQLFQNCLPTSSGLI
jgi:hypothetical protein